ncbi:hypothetical protein B0H34DRAFT_797815 [Crassisporium funariophilum]|nr:hypothetical protein B0H34DRAFT_797815 [Crassisporium funariophilum]
MPAFFSRWRKRVADSDLAWASVQESRTLIGDRPKSASFVEQKIHPDLNSLAEELASSQGHGSEKHVVDCGRSELLPEISGFIALEPCTRRGRTEAAHIRARKASVMGGNGDSQIAEHSRAGSSSGTSQERKVISLNTETLTPDKVSLFLDMATTTLPEFNPSHRPASSPKKRWSPFGRCPSQDLPRTRVVSDESSIASRSMSQSSMSLRSRATSGSRITLADMKQFTPGSQGQSVYTSASNTRTNSSYNVERENIPPSPHTFGVPTPPPLPSTPTSYQEGPYFGFRETPPPLPPLDHPAFHQPSKAFCGSSSRQIFAGFHDAQNDITGHRKSTRHSHSLPSLTDPKSDTQSNSTRCAIKRHTRKRSNTDDPRARRTSKDERYTSHHTTSKRHHTRSESKSSIASSRRSSAEYSAKQASSLGHGSANGECWEVQVSKEMVRLALGEVQQIETKSANPTWTSCRSQDARTSAYGKARGKNVGSLALLLSQSPPHRLTGEVVELGSPFFLQDTLSHNLTLTDTGPTDDFTTDRLLPKLVYQASRSAPAKTSRYDNQAMSHDPSIPTTSAVGNGRRKGKETAVGDVPSPASSQSRRGGRGSSRPSRTRTPSPPPAKLDTVPFFGSMQGSSSFLTPPTLSVIAPTPEASPISPIRRTHHKSTPSMPTSVLRTPSTPTVIEKSYSSGSGKRKADEAGVGGDKTPPKASKEPRATFAPEPRTHRASATSGSSGHAPSSFNRSKRVRLTNSSSDTRTASRSGSRAGTLPTPEDISFNAKNTGSWSSRGSHGPMTATSHTHGSHGQPHRTPSRRSLSQASIPISALVSPHAPSVGRSGTFHMRDPRKPAPVQTTPWTLSFPSQVHEGEPRWSWKGWVERGGSPLHAWLFFIGFLVFPLWWAAAFVPIPRTRRLGGTDAEKGVILDDPQVEHDAYSWRVRCRVMAGVSLITYIPFIALVAVFA